VVVAQLRDLGVAGGDVLLVHTSLRAVGPIVGGAAGLIEALVDAVGPTGTLVVPAWSDEDDVPFDPARSEVSAGLGVLPRVFWRRPGVLRASHVHAFAAHGPSAAALLRDPLPLPPHVLRSPVGRVYEADGKVLLLGVGHDANTTVHLAEVLASVPYGVPKHCTVLREGVPTRVDYRENDHCCARFALADGWLRAEGLQREGVVAHGHARLTRAREVVRVVCGHLEGDPLLFLHPPSSGCGDCDEARSGIAGVGPP
jgi:aminoglycoside N3'-acetyltransferase